jgi:ABC-2 type transport system ATP-binding protein
MKATHGFFELKTNQTDALTNFLETTASFGQVKIENGLITAFLKEEMNAEELNKTLFEKGIFLSHLVKRKESLEEQFLELTKNQPQS